MIILYTSPGCASCRKAKQWLKDNEMTFVEKNIFTTLLKEEEIKYLPVFRGLHHECLEAILRKS